MENTQEKAREAIKEMLDKMGFECEIETKIQKEGEIDRIVFNIKTDDSGVLIGQYGGVLEELQHLARLLVRRVSEDKINFILDINAYRQEKNESLIRLARNSANQAVEERQAVALRPMSAYERRMIHMELADDPRVETESAGSGEDRKVVIKPSNVI